jgi:prepilin-type processing-associated H-X9-DG protein
LRINRGDIWGVAEDSLGGKTTELHSARANYSFADLG